MYGNPLQGLRRGGTEAPAQITGLDAFGPPGSLRRAMSGPLATFRRTGIHFIFIVEASVAFGALAALAAD